MASTQTDVIDGVSGSTAIKAPVRVATTANITLSGTQTIDGVAVVADDRVLVKDQTTATENGIYNVSATAWSRAADFDGNRDIRKGTLVLVNEGTIGAKTRWRCTTSDPIIIGTSNIAFENAEATTLASSISNATEKTTPVDADLFGILDSAASYVLKKLTWSNIKATLATTLMFLHTATGAVSRTVRSRLADTVNVKDFGATGDGVADDTAEIQAAIDALLANGGTVFFPHGTYLISSSLTVVDNNVLLIGEGGAQFLNDKSVASNAATILKWGGGASPMIRWGENATAHIYGGGIRGIELDASGTATYCLSLLDVKDQQFSDIMLRRAVTDAILIGNLTDMAGGASAAGFSRWNNIRIDLRGQSTDSANGIHIAGNETTLQGVTQITFDGVAIDHANGHAVKMTGGDAIIFDRLFTFRSGSETGRAVSIEPSATTEGFGVHFRNVTCGTGAFHVAALNNSTAAQRVWVDHRSNITSFTGAGIPQIFLFNDRGLMGQQARRLGWVNNGKIQDEMLFVRYDSTNLVVHTCSGNYGILNGAGTGTSTNPVITRGGVRVTTGASSGDRTSLVAGIALLGNPIARSNSPQLEVMTAPTAITSIKYRFGWMATDADPPDDGIYIEFDVGTDANFYAVTRASGTSTRTDTAIAGSATRRHWLITATSTQVTFFTKSTVTDDWDVVATHTTNIPSATMGLIFQVITTTTAAKSADIARLHYSFDAE